MELQRNDAGYSPPDDEIKATMARRLEELDAKIATVRAEVNRLTDQMAAAQRERDALHDLLAIWDHQPEGSNPSSANGIGALAEGGAQFVGDASDLVVKLLEEVQRPLHFREIEKELRARNWYVARGNDPANTLLAKYFDDERLYRPSRGVYAIRPAGKTVRSVGTRKKAGQRTRGTR